MLPPIAWRPVALVAALTSGTLIALAGRYGYHRDELYYLVAGRHPAWGYDDQPPLVPLVGRLMADVSGGALTALRLPSALLVGVTVLLVALLAREMGGGRAAQVLAAVCWATAPQVIVSGHLLSTTPFDLFFWTLLAYLLVRWIRTRDDRLLLAGGAVVGVGLEAKNLILLYVAGLLAGVAISGPRDLFRRPALWIGGAIALLLWAPNLWWQATHGWPQVEMTAVIRQDADFGGRLGLLPSQLLMIGPPLAVVWGVGLWRLLRDTARTHRAFGWAYLVVLALVLATGGREYYPGGAYPPLLAAGAVAVTGWLAAHRRRWVLVAAAVLAVNATVTVMIGLPVFPARILKDTPQAALNYDSGETVGWPELTAAVARVRDGLPPGERDTVVVLTANYGEAGAIDRYGSRHGLPPAYSGHLGFWRWGPPPDTATGPVILIGHWTAADTAPYCESFTPAGRQDNGYGLDNEEQGVPIAVCRGLKGSWSALWPDLRRLG
ncbi:ArnT family glycosyltransferase [Rhizomonospora bruguierae]|uniref:ArnT family glycosyltransferase n=1 Tax=Rhizomonospora bruguierae TaxID=1581705 RepID=UPI001BCB8D77|nr:glycosyltransferase family 39 protein [Micromonospora sp. NBRC 107566]